MATRQHIVMLAAACLLLLSGSCSAARHLKQAQPTPWEVVSTTPGLEILASLLRVANLTDTLDQPGLNYTFILPNNASFIDLEINQGITVDMLRNSSALQSILLYHVYPNGGLTPNNLYAGEELTMANNDTVTVLDVADLGLPLAFRDTMGRMIAPASPSQPNISIGDSVAYIVSSVLLPITPTTIAEALSYQTSLTTMSNFLQFLRVQELNDNSTDYFGSILNETMLAGTGLNATNMFVTDLLYSNTTNVTFLVPNNLAFESLCLNASVLTNVSNVEYFRKALLAHIIPVSLDFDVLVALNGTTIPTLLPDASYNVEYMYGTVILIGNGTVPSTLVVTPDLVAGLSKIHVVNQVLFPDIPGKPEYSCPPPVPGDYSQTGVNNTDYQAGSPPVYGGNSPVYGGESPVAPTTPSPAYGGSA